MMRAGAVAKAGIARKKGERNRERAKRTATVTAADPDEGTDYVLTSEALKDDVQRDFIFQQCMKEIASLRAKYGALVDFDAALRESIGAKRTRKKAS